jgi:hypothetical protein
MSNCGGKRAGTGRKKVPLAQKRKLIGVVLDPKTIELFKARVPASKRSVYIEELLLASLKSN